MYKNRTSLNGEMDAIKIILRNVPNIFFVFYNYFVFIVKLI